ncbi:hypothetical protein [Cryobacterium cryoconiti]|uniref:Uncharacterized protein n=1 Tax=Cryobacterium cryoconiti TaxID=1259239 RepID=A0A4Y8JSG2_9MICO|nr:hypothetical protein [Cryobacterium cryoconiti]TFD27460.1 hypothetical protein E3T49_13025 [Cryobacterium cryoconiti]
MNTTPAGPTPASLAARHHADRLAVDIDRARGALDLAASCLAYDVTVRAADPTGPGHDAASPELTAKLKASYLAALDHERAIGIVYRAAVAQAEAAEAEAGCAVTR